MSAVDVYSDVNIPKGWLDVLATMAHQPWTWVAEATLTRAGHAAETLAAMAVAGWIERWDVADDPPAGDGKGPGGRKPRRIPVRRRVDRHGQVSVIGGCPTGVCYALTDWAAERLVLETIEQGAVGRPRWGRSIAAHERAARRGLALVPSPLPGWEELPEPPTHYEEYTTMLRLPGGLADTRPGPELEAMMAETTGRLSREPRIDPVTGDPVMKPALTAEVVDEGGQRVLDPETGRPIREKVIVMGREVELTRRPLRGKGPT